MTSDAPARQRADVAWFRSLVPASRRLRPPHHLTPRYPSSVIERNPKNAPGPFYTERGQCIACGAPEDEAPDLVAYDDEAGCYFRRQPENAEEVEAALSALLASCVDAYRYGGDDVPIRRRLAQIGRSSLCDRPLQDVREVVRSHVCFEHEGPRTARAFVELFQTWFPSDPIAVRRADDGLAIFDVPCGHQGSSSWDLALHRCGGRTWLLRDRAGARLPFHFHDVLAHHGATQLRWLSAKEWARGELGEATPY